MDNDDFLGRIGSDLRALMEEDREITAEEERLRQRRQDIRGRIADLNRAASIYRDYMKLPNDTKPPATVTIFPDLAPSATSGAKPTRTMADVAQDYMKAHGGRAKVKDIVGELVRLNRLTGKHSDYGSVFGTLKRNEKRFIKVGEGEFALIGS